MTGRAVKAGALAAAVVAVAAALVVAFGPRHGAGNAATEWRATAAEALGGPAPATDVMTQSANWKSGTLTADAFRQAETAHLRQLAGVRDRVAALPPFPGDPLVADLYTRSAQLEVEWVRMTLDLADLPPGAARDQLDLMARRVAEMADRSRALADPPPPASPATPPDVPDWKAEGLAAGPPLDGPAGPPAAPLPQAPATRPTGPRATWVAAVAGAPTPSALAGAIYADDPGADQNLARSLTAKADALLAVPDPVPGGRVEAARVRLGLLVDADAARAAQLAVLSHTDELIASAQRLLLIGAGMWSPDLGPHTTGLDPRILAGDGR